MKFSNLFPTPQFIMPTTVGLDFSDTSLRFLSLEQKKEGLIPAIYKEVPLAPGVVVGGRIKDPVAFSTLIKDLKQKHGLHFVKVSIPESQLYLCTLSLQKSDAPNLVQAIELVIEDHIPLTLPEAVFDFSILREDPESIIVQVVATARVNVEELHTILTDAGLVPMAFELEGQAIARAVLPEKDTGTHMIVDFGATRTAITIVTGGIAVFTSTLEFGGARLTSVLAHELRVSIEEAESLKRNYGLRAVGERRDIFEIISGGVSTLKDEINRRYVYWHEQNDQSFHFPRISDVYICGGHSNLQGLTDYLSASLKLRVIQASPWVNCFSLEKLVPAIPKEAAMSFITSVGLCLSDYE